MIPSCCWVTSSIFVLNVYKFNNLKFEVIWNVVSINIIQTIILEVEDTWTYFLYNSLFFVFCFFFSFWATKNGGKSSSLEQLIRMKSIIIYTYPTEKTFIRSQGVNMQRLLSGHKLQEKYPKAVHIAHFRYRHWCSYPKHYWHTWQCT